LTRQLNVELRLRPKRISGFLCLEKFAVVPLTLKDPTFNGFFESALEEKDIPPPQDYLDHSLEDDLADIAFFENQDYP
jgi:hypothetical protein